jgi:hypothetical protein
MTEFDKICSRNIKWIEDYNKDIKTANKIINYDSYSARIVNQIKVWKKTHEYNQKLVNQMAETLNEVCIAHYLSLDDDCIGIEYEVITGKSKKSIDFKTSFTRNRVFYIDVKTVHPTNKDNWEDFLKNIKYIDGEVHLDKDGLGGIFWHNMRASRTKFINYTYEYEEKIKEHSCSECNYFMMFCGNNFNWHKSELEDFVEFYLTGQFIAWDHFASMTKHYMSDKGIVFSKVIDNFSLLFRKEYQKDYKINPFVRVDKQFRDYI